MTNVVEMLSQQLQRPVEDRTGLSDKYDFVLRCRDASQQELGQSSTDAASELDEALQHSLGLKLRLGKSFVQVLVIEHLSKPKLEPGAKPQET